MRTVIPISICWVLAVFLLCGSASALSLTFQDASDFATHITCTSPTGSCAWVDTSPSCGNSYIRVNQVGPASNYIINKDAQTTTYAAATVLAVANTNFSIQSASWSIILYDSSFNTLYSYNIADGGSTGRLEVAIVGGSAMVYQNGVLKTVSAPLAVNPSYIGFGLHDFGGVGAYASIDDFVYGTTENKYIFSSPSSSCYLLKDLINPANTGLYNSSNIAVSNFNMTTTWGKGTTTPESISLYNYFGGGFPNPSNTVSTGSDTSGTIAWDLNSVVFNNPSVENTKYGFYVSTIPGSGSFSTQTKFLSSGATVAFDSTSYAVGNTATISYTVSPGYWLPATYTYKMDIIDVFGNVVSSQPVTIQLGSVQYTWVSTNTNGVYYAVLKATPIAGGSDIWMNYATTTLTAYVSFNGYVMNAENGTVINGALINVTQLLNTKNSTSLSNGAWNSTNNWLSGSAYTIITSASGYTQETLTRTPLSAGAITLNLSLMPAPPSSTGVSIGGIVRDNQYGNPIVGATYHVMNGTDSTAITNIAGYARVNGLYSGRLYDVWSSKLGFGDSTHFPVVAVGI